MLYSLLDYGNEFIEKSREKVARNSLFIIDFSICEKFQLRQFFHLLDVGKQLSSINNIRRRDPTTITNMIDGIIDKEIIIDELTNKRELLRNDVNRIIKYCTKFSF